MKHLLYTFETWVHRLSKWSLVIACVILFGMMILTFTDVLGRYFIRPIPGVYELTESGLALLIFLGLAFTQIKKEHVSVGFLVDKFPKKIQGIIDVVTYSMLFLLLLSLSWQMIVYGNRIIGLVTTDLGLPVSMFIFLSVFGVTLYALTLFLELIDAMRRVVFVK